jgi:hypothetical protein
LCPTGYSAGKNNSRGNARKGLSVAPVHVRQNFRQDTDIKLFSTLPSNFKRDGGKDFYIKQLSYQTRPRRHAVADICRFS